MSKCISLDGEYSEHQPSEDEFVCGLCFAFDEDAAVAAIAEQRSRIAALEAVIEKVREAARESEYGELFYSTVHVDRALALDTSTLVDQMIREAKAEAETERDALQQRIDAALFQVTGMEELYPREMVANTLRGKTR